MAYITGLGGTPGAGWFTDQNGSPRLVVGDAAWGLPPNAGRWDGDDWQATYDSYLSARAAQGYTVIYTDPLGSTHNGGAFDNGSTYDGIPPFTGGDPSAGLVDAFWQRIDYLLDRAQALDLTVFLNLGGSWDMEFTGYALTGKTSTQYQAYGTAVATRYLTQPNLLWHIADDYFGNEDTQIAALLTGIRGAGDTRPISIENFAESTSRQDVSNGTALPWGAAHAQWNFCYSYNVSYFSVEKAYLESSPIPVCWSDGYFYTNNGTEELLMRSLVWWALSSGSRGWITGDERIWQWQSNAAADTVTGTWPTSTVRTIRSAFETLNGWHRLIPDTSSQLVTGGRGTHATSFASGGTGGSYTGSTDAYVTASRTADGTLAVIFLSHPATITVDQSKMAAGYGAKWMDPVTGATTAATVGSSYNSAAPGTNSAGGTDWVLVLASPPYATWTIP